MTPPPLARSRRRRFRRRRDSLIYLMSERARGMNSDDGGFPRTIRPSLIQFIHHPAAAIHSTFPSVFPNLSVNVLAALAVLSISKPLWIMYVQ